MDDIQLNPFQIPQDQTPKVDLGGNQGFDVPSPETTSFKAAKASFGLGKMTGKPFGDFYAQIANGQELPMRQEAAAQADQNQAKRKQAVITQAVQSGATSDDLKGLVGPSKRTDPQSVIEEYHAASYFQPLWDKVTPDVAKDVNKAYEAINAGVSNLTYKNYAVDRTQKSLDNYQHQSWTGWTADQLKNLSQIYTEWKLRGGYSGSWSNLLGTELDQERQKAYSMPFDEFKTWFDGRMDQLDKDNPSLALAFGSAIIGQSVHDIQNNNATTMIGVPADLAALGSGAADVISATNRIRGAVQGVVRSSTHVDPTVPEILGKSTKIDTSKMKDVTPQDIHQAQAAGHGDTKEAAIQSVSERVSDRLEHKDNPEQQAVKSLPALMRTDIDDIKNNTGNLGTDVANRVIEQMEARQIDFVKGVTDLLKVNRTPVAVASEDFARAATEWAIKKYAGPNSTVALVDHSLLYDAASNTYHLPLQITRHDGTYFANEAEAVSHAEVYGWGLEEPSTTTRRYWDDEVTAAAFDVEHYRQQIKKYEGYTKQRFKPKEYYELEKKLREANQRKKNAWSQRAGAYWKPEQPIEAKLGAITLQKQGLGWYIQAYVPLDETQSWVRDSLLKMPGAYSGPARKGPRSGTLTPYLEDLVTGSQTDKFLASSKVFLDSFLGRAGFEPFRGIRTPEETLSPEENIQRKVATHVPSKFADTLFGEDAKTLAAVPRKQLKDLRRLLVANQTMIDPVTGEPGYFFKNINDIENWYQTYAGRFPSEEEVKGYFAYTGMYETDRAIRSLSLLRNKWRSGVESFRIKIGGKWTDRFDAVKINHLPSPFERSPVYISMGDTVKVTGGYSKELKDGVEQGKYTVLELWNREDRPFHSASKNIPSDTEPRYVITDQLDRRPISPDNQVPRRGGGHWMFPYDHYVKIPNIYFDKVTKQWIYKGDVTAMPFNNVALGQKITSHLNALKNLIADGLIDDARDMTNYLGVAGLNFDKDILGAFKGYTDSDGKFVPPRFPLHRQATFRLVPADKTIMDLDNSLKKEFENEPHELLDTTRYGNMARNNAVEFTGQRDAWGMHTIDDAGTPNNPIYSYRPAKLADPIDVINRGITKISNSTWLDDYKYFAAEHWYETYKNWLDIDKGGSPFYHFTNPIWKTATPDAVKELAMSNRKKARDFISMPSPLATYAHKVMTSAAGAIYNKAGAQAYNMFAPLVEVPFEKSPTKALRSLVADMKIGLGSIPAFAMQASAWVNLIGFEPRYVAAGTRAALLHTYARLIPQHIDHLDKIASFNLRGLSGQHAFNPGQFKHLWDGLSNKTDFAHVGSEHAFQDFALRDRYMKNKKDLARYWGGTFFREAAQFVRQAGWYISGLKWITENEGKLPNTRDDWAKIQDYATLLDHNMSRASNSSINTGIMSMPAQFYTYDRNLAEDMWGKRITPGQKLGLFMANGLMWGFPFGSLGLFGAPIGYAVNKYMLSNDPFGAGQYIPGANTAQSILMEGIPAFVIASLTGGGDPHKGTWYDFSRFGVKGWGLLTGLFSDDARWWNILGAAPASVINTTLRSYPLWQDIGAVMHGVTTSQPTTVVGVGPVYSGGDFSKFNPTGEDLADLLKEWSGFSYAHRLYTSLKTGKLMSNNNTILRDNETAGQAVTQFITGLTPSEVSNISENFGILGDREQQKTFLIRQGTRNYNLALLAAKDNSDLDHNETYRAFMKKLQIILDMAPSPKDKADIMKAIFARNKPLVEAIEEQLGTKMATQEDLEKYKRQIELNQGKQ